MRSIAWFTGFLLPIPIFIDVTTGSLQQFGTRSGAIPPLPLSSLSLVVILIGIVFSFKSIYREVVRSAYASLYSIYFIFFISMSVLIFLVNQKAAFFSLQWAYPFPFYIYFIGVFKQYHLRNYFVRGLTVGGCVALTVVIAALVLDVQGFFALGRINPIDPPLPGLYQLGNYTPHGLIVSGALLLSLTSYVQASGRIRAAIALGLIVSGGGLFGSREALALSLSVIVMFVVWQVRRGRVLIVSSGVVLAVTIFGLAIDLSQIGSLKRLGQTSEGVGMRISILADRGLDRFQDSLAYGSLAASSASTPARQSSHNTYVDLMVDFGIVGLLLALLLIGATCSLGVGSIWKGFTSRSELPSSKGAFLLGGLVVMVVVLSSNLRVPLLQPYPSALFFVLVSFLLYARSEKAEHMKKKRPLYTLAR